MAKKGDQYWNYVDSLLDDYADDSAERTPARPRRRARRIQDGVVSGGDVQMNRNTDQPEGSAYQRRYYRARPEEGQQQRPPQNRRPVPPQQRRVPPQNNGRRAPQQVNRSGAPRQQRPPVQPAYRRPPQQRNGGRRPPPSPQQNRGYRAPAMAGGPPPQNGRKPKRRFRDLFPQKGDGAKESIRKIVSLLSAIVLIGCVIYFAFAGIMSYQNSHSTSKLSKLLNAENNSSWAEIRQKYPGVEFPEGMQKKFAALYAQNQDLAGWISIPGLNINYPVMQGSNDDQYLRHNFNKEYTVYGTPFLSSYNSIKTLDQNSTIYAHSMRRDDQMFTPLKAYRSVQGFKDNPLIEFDTLYKDYYFKVYAVFISNGNADGDNGYLFNYTWNKFSSDADFAEFIRQINQRKLYSTGVDISTTDKILTLSTCNYDFDDCRLVIVGRMVRPGESKHVSTRHVVKNPNPRFPQAYYDAKGLTNPYAQAKKWEPSAAH